MNSIVRNAEVAGSGLAAYCVRVAQAEQVVERLYSRDGKASGPWDSEPDRIAWTDPDAGYPCLMRRSNQGSWCGYVAVPPGHTAHGWDFDALCELEVHGGLTYSAACLGDPGKGVCHVPAEGEPDDVWWLGFDCAHAWDDNWMMAQGRCDFLKMATWRGPAYSYRDVGYVRQQCSRLAQQLKAL